jgi:ribosomal-protein-alanine N-acetyltransferase
VTQPGSATAPDLPPDWLSMQGQPWLAVEDLTLRPWQQSDAPGLVHAYADPDIHQWHARSMTLAEAESWVQHELDRWGQDRGGSWAITREDVLVGRIGIGGVPLEEARAGVTYWVLPEARGRGVACLSLNAVATWALDAAGFHRLELDHSTQNPASCRVATKAGFLPEGTRGGRALHLDGWHDMHAHALLAHDARSGSRGTKVA